MICVPISRNSRGSIALTLPCVPTDINTGVSTTPWAVVSFPTRALDEESVFRSWNMGLIAQTGGWIDGLMDCWIVGKAGRAGLFFGVSFVDSVTWLRRLG